MNEFVLSLDIYFFREHLSFCHWSDKKLMIKSTNEVNGKRRVAIKIVLTSNDGKFMIFCLTMIKTLYASLYVGTDTARARSERK